MSISEGIEETDCYFEPIRQDANRRLLGIKKPEYESFEENDYITEEYDTVLFCQPNEILVEPETEVEDEPVEETEVEDEPVEETENKE